jgi:hypothetical protein
MCTEEVVCEIVGKASSEEEDAEHTNFSKIFTFLHLSITYVSPLPFFAWFSVTEHLKSSVRSQEPFKEECKGGVVF